MPTFLESLFGKKKPSSAAVGDELSKVEAALAAAPARIERAKAALGRVADMTDAEHEAALAELSAAERAKVRLEAQAEQLRIAVVEAEKAEAADALRARADAAKKRLAAMKTLLDRFDEQAAALAATGQEIDAIDGEVAAVNCEIDAAKKAGLEAPEPVRTSAEIFRTEPDTITPDREVFDEVFFVDGRRAGAMVTVEHNGRQVPTVAGAELRKVRRTIPGERKPGRRMESPTTYLTLPATRLGGKVHWPR